MNSKKLNIIMLVSVILFCIIFGVAAAVRAARLDELDRLHDQQQEQQREQEEQDAVNNAETTQKNEQSNSGTNNNNSVQSQIDFSTFTSMYTAAEEKLKNATNVMSEVTNGSLIISGPTNYGGITVESTPLTINFGRYRNATQQRYDFKVFGPMLDGLFVLNYTSILYSESAVYNYYFNQRDTRWQTISKAEQLNKFGWTVNDTFHTAANGGVKNSTTVIYDKTNKTYTASAELNCSKASGRISQFLMGVMDATGPAKYESSKITVTVKENGSFERIRYQEKFKITVYHAGYDARIDATVVADYTEIFTSVNENGIYINKPDMS